MAPALSATEFKGPIVVTVCYFLVYYAFILNVLRVKVQEFKAAKARGEKFDRYFGRNDAMLAADRAQLNMLEQMVPFLSALWMHALFVSIETATLAGGVYVAARAFYPLAMGSKVGLTNRVAVLIVTVPNYACILYLAFTALYAALA